ncbi:MAG TPA: iron dicitrate transport regulator FecR, partial [Bordetella sp.]
DGMAELYLASGMRAGIVRRGEYWRLAADGASQLAQPDFDVTSWADGSINAHRMRLADLLAELARYRVGHIACDPSVADLRLTGVYQLDDIDQTLRFIAQTQPVRIVRRTPLWLSVVPAGA